VDGKVIVPSSSLSPDTTTIPPTTEKKKKVIVFLHGLLGNSKNLHTPAKRLTRYLGPDYAALLLDVRGHGHSSSSTSTLTFDKPHSFRNCVMDIFQTLHPLGLVGMNSPKVIIGHSLGGRIALEYSHTLRLVGASSTSTVAHTKEKEDSIRAVDKDDDDDDIIFTLGQQFHIPKQTWILDSVPGIADPSVHGVLRAISSIPLPVPSKKWLVDTLISEPYDLELHLSRWIMTNLHDEKDGMGLRWVFDLDIANELIMNFDEQDFEKMISNITSTPTDPSSSTSSSSSSSVHLVMAGKNNNWTEEIVSKLKSIHTYRRGEEEEESSSLSYYPTQSSSFQMHKLEKAGHWVHVDDLEGLLRLMINEIQRQW
jgi:dienelactone hydrolase